MLGIDLIII